MLRESSLQELQLRSTELTQMISWKSNLERLQRIIMCINLELFDGPDSTRGRVPILSYCQARSLDYVLRCTLLLRLPVVLLSPLHSS